MAIAFSKGATGSATASSLGIAFVGGSTSGHLLVGVLNTTVLNDTVSVTDTLTDSYHLCIRNTNTVASQYIFYGIAKSTGANTVTFTTGTSGVLSGAILEYSGFTGTPVIELVSGATGISASANSGAAVVGTGALLVGAVNFTVSTNDAAPSGWTNRENFGTGVLVAADQITASETSFSYAPTNSSTPTTWIAQMVAFINASTDNLGYVNKQHEYANKR